MTGDDGARRTKLGNAAFAAFIRSWNAGGFFEAHEALEALWVLTRDRGQQGLIQLAAALHHVRRGNLRGARTMIERALPRLTDPEACEGPIDLASVADYARRLRAAIDAGNASQAADDRIRL